MDKVFFQTSLKESFPTYSMTIRKIIHVLYLKILWLTKSMEWLKMNVEVVGILFPKPYPLIIVHSHL